MPLVDLWRDDAFLHLEQGERFDILHAPFWQTEAEEPSEAIRVLDAQSHALHAVIVRLETHLRGLL